MWQRKTSRWLLFILFPISLAAAPNTVNKRVTYQGFLTNTSGTAYPDGTYRMRFTIKHDNTNVWRKAYNTVTLTNGVFNVSFSGNDDSAVAFDAGLFSLSSGAVSMNVDVEIDVDNNGSYDNSFTAVPLSAVPTAMVAELANTTGTDAVATASIQNGAVTAAKMTAGDYSSVLTSGTYSINVSGNASTSTTAGDVTGTVAIANGGTGATSAANARTNLAAAKSGANSDITSLTGLTTALSVGQGGTGATAAAGARTNLGAAASGANSDITSLSGLTTALSVAQGGTGATDASGARTNLGVVIGTNVAAAGANSDITSLSGLTTPLSVAQGGTGSATQNFVDLTTNQTAAGNKTFSGTTALTGIANLSLLALPNTNTNIAANTTYNDATPFVYTTAFHTLTIGANTVALSCINSTAATAGSILVIVANPTLGATVAGFFTVTHNTSTLR